MEESDQNTKFVHAYANHYKNHNTIWDLVNGSGNKFHGFRALAILGVSHFGELFKAPKHETMGNMFIILAQFLSVVEEDENEDLF